MSSSKESSDSSSLEVKSKNKRKDKGKKAKLDISDSDDGKKLSGPRPGRSDKRASTDIPVPVEYAEPPPGWTPAGDGRPAPSSSAAGGAGPSARRGSDNDMPDNAPAGYRMTDKEREARMDLTNAIPHEPPPAYNNPQGVTTAQGGQTWIATGYPATNVRPAPIPSAQVYVVQETPQEGVDWRTMVVRCSICLMICSLALIALYILTLGSSSVDSPPPAAPPPPPMNSTTTGGDPNAPPPPPPSVSVAALDSSSAYLQIGISVFAIGAGALGVYAGRKENKRMVLGFMGYLCALILAFSIGQIALEAGTTDPDRFSWPVIVLVSFGLPACCFGGCIYCGCMYYNLLKMRDRAAAASPQNPNNAGGI